MSDIQQRRRRIRNLDRHHPAAGPQRLARRHVALPDRPAIVQLVIVAPAVKRDASDRVAAVGHEALHTNFAATTTAAVNAERKRPVRARQRRGQRVDARAVLGGVVAAQVNGEEAAQAAVLVNGIRRLCVGRERQRGDGHVTVDEVAQRAGGSNVAVVRGLGALGGLCRVNGLPALVLLQCQSTHAKKKTITKREGVLGSLCLGACAHAGSRPTQSTC